MSDFAPRSLGMGHLLFGIGLFIVAAVFGLTWIDESHVDGQDARRSRKGLDRLLADVNRRIADVEGDLAIEEVEFLREQEKRRRYDLERGVRGELAAVIAELEQVRETIPGLEREVLGLVSERASYRNQMREQLWQSVIGRDLSEGDLLRKQPYDGMVITEVDAAGLVVRHRSGVARIPVSDLAPAFLEKLDLDREEGEVALREMLEKDSKAKRNRGPQVEPAEEIPLVIRRSQRLVELRTRMVKLDQLILERTREANAARHHDQHSKNRSAPGSLETWGERAQRLESQVLVYQNERAKFEMELQKLVSE